MEQLKEETSLGTEKWSQKLLFSQSIPEPQSEYSPQNLSHAANPAKPLCPWKIPWHVKPAPIAALIK